MAKMIDLPVVFTDKTYYPIKESNQIEKMGLIQLTKYVKLHKSSIFTRQTL